MEFLDIKYYLQNETLLNAARALLTLLVGYVIAKLAAKSIGRLVKKHASLHQHIMLQRAVFYFLFVFLYPLFSSSAHRVGLRLNRPPDSGGQLRKVARLDRVISETGGISIFKDTPLTKKAHHIGKPFFYKYRYNPNNTITAYLMIGFSNDGRDVLVRYSFC